MRTGSLISILLTGVVLIAGCTRKSTEAENLRSMVEIEQRGVRARASVSTTSISIADRVVLLLEVYAPSSTEIELPTVDESLGDFTVVESSTQPARLVNGEMMSSMRVLLEPFLSGEYALPVLSIAVRHDSESELEYIDIAPPIIHVSSVLDDSPESASIGELKGVVDPSDPTAEADRTWIAATTIASVVTLGLIGIAIVLLRRKRAKKPIDLCEVGLARLTSLAGDEQIPENAVDTAYDAIRLCLSCTIEPQAGSLTPEQLLARPNIVNALAETDRESLGACLLTFQRLQYSPGASESTDLHSLFRQSADLVRTLAEHADDSIVESTTLAAPGGDG